MRGARWVVPVLGLSVLAGLTVLYFFDRPLYLAVLTAVMIQPGDKPFIDIAQMPGVVACWWQGVDPYLTGSCDLAGRPFAYSPLWLRAGFLPTGPDARLWLGFGLDSAFFLSLALLPPPHRWSGLVVLALAAFSGLPGFALERVNIDVVMFLLIIAGGWISLRGGAARILGDALLFLAGLLKFYPLVLCLLFLRERFGRAVLISAVALAALILFILYFHTELAEMAGNLPVLGYFTDTFGARQLAIGLDSVLRELGADRLPWFADFDSKNAFVLPLSVLIFSHLAAFVMGLRLALKPAMRAALMQLTASESGFLLIGAMLFCGCFFAGQNVAYRGIHFLFIIPGLAALALSPAASEMRSLFRVTLGLALLLLWGFSLQQAIALVSGGSARPMGGSVAMDLYWIGHELAWWFVITMLLAVVFRFIMDSPVWRSLPWSPRPA